MSDLTRETAMPTASADTPRTLIARAREAARAFKRRDEPLGWTEALELAPWPKGAPPAWEREVRTAFAEGLVKRGIAEPARRRVPDVQRARAGKVSMRRLVSGSPDEFAAQDAKAAAAGLSWASWARRQLASAM